MVRTEFFYFLIDAENHLTDKYEIIAMQILTYCNA